MPSACTLQFCNVSKPKTDIIISAHTYPKVGNTLLVRDYLQIQIKAIAIVVTTYGAHMNN